MVIDTAEQLKVHLKLMKRKLQREGYDGFQLYPAFCLLYTENNDRYQLPKEVVLNMACKILVEEP